MKNDKLLNSMWQVTIVAYAMEQGDKMALSGMGKPTSLLFPALAWGMRGVMASGGRRSVCADGCWCPGSPGVGDT